MRQGEYISNHEQQLGTKIAEGLSGGNNTPARLSAVEKAVLLQLGKF